MGQKNQDSTQKLGPTRDKRGHQRQRQELESLGTERNGSVLCVQVGCFGIPGVRKKNARSYAKICQREKEKEK